MAEEKEETKSSSTTTKPKEKKTGSRKKTIRYNPDFSLSDSLQLKFVNCIMKRGKKSVAQKILSNTFDELNRKGQKNVSKVFETAIAKVTPTMEVRPKRIGGAIYQIPIEVQPKRQETLAIRWLLKGARARKGMPMYKRLAAEILDASNETGFAFNKKEEAHKMAQSNKAFAHLARY